jgi:hypothetical protein
MDHAQAERWVTISALAVLGIYAYRRLAEPAATTAPKAKELAGIGPPPPLGTFATAWGFTFLVIAVIAEAAPGLGAGFALLVATADFLTNAQSALDDVIRLEKPASSKQASSQTSSKQTKGTTRG